VKITKGRISHAEIETSSSVLMMADENAAVEAWASSSFWRIAGKFSDSVVDR
jgi:uncharacterized glyoxalase superfamily protein PhnB